MSAKHTPGPWEYVNSRPPDAPEWMSVPKFVRAPRATVKNDRGPSYARCILEDDDYPEKDADGHLVAAAPDLFYALKMAIQHIERPELSPDASVVLERAQAAIAKAAGDTQKE